MKDQTIFVPDFNALSAIIAFLIFFILNYYLDWGYSIAVFLAVIVGLSVRFAWMYAIANEERVDMLVKLHDRFWWVIPFIVVVVVSLLLFMDRWFFNPYTYIYGELFAGFVLAYTGGREWTNGRKLHAIILFISCLGWFLLALDMAMFGFRTSNNSMERFQTREISTLLFFIITVGISLFTFIWFLIDSLMNIYRGENLDSEEVITNST